ncbi:peptidoglycan-binding domain-containing protein [Scrofimicrobium sp. R131]|uniref:Peptidoglycan-binding domain-containing protein n=1 Tax=Scrofimicrobium appendicitidis TaxID=3079930 RepID=A0AAU7V633_9ACTO
MKKLLVSVAGAVLCVGGAALPAMAADSGDSGVAPASLVKCNTSTLKYLLNNQQARVPSSSSGTEWVDCWLDVDQVNYSSAVYYLQLNGLKGGEYKNIVADGYYGPDTAAAVAQVQYDRGLAVDGIYGYHTGYAMYWKSVSGSISKWL